MTDSALTPEQTRALEYLRRAGTQAPVADIRRKVAETFRELDALVAEIPEAVVRDRPRPGRWCVQEVVDHLIVSHRPAAEELAMLLLGEVPTDGPIPASLQSPDAMEKDWPALLREMSAVHGRMVSHVAEATEDTPLQARAPVVMVIKARGEDGELRPCTGTRSWIGRRTPWRSGRTRWSTPRRSVPFWPSCPLEGSKGEKKRSGRRKIAAPEFGLKEVW